MILLNYSIIKEVILRLEGDTLIKDDNNYLAKFGINQYYNPEVDVSKITLDDAINIYREKYLPKISKCNHYALQLLLFCYGINIGMSNAVKKLQDILEITSDGVFGSKTKAAVDNYVALRGIQLLCFQFTDKMIDHYQQVNRNLIHRVSETNKILFEYLCYI